MIKERWIAWPLGFLAVSLYAFSCYQSQLYGEFFLQIIYAILAIYGWYSWRKNTHSHFTVSKLSIFQYITSIIAGVSLSVISYYGLKYLGSSLPVLDGITNGFAIVATILAAQKKIDNWLFWIPINALTIWMMLIKAMPFYGVLYLFYLIFAIIGYLKWRKSLISSPRSNVM